MPTPSPTPLSTLRHAIAGFLAGGGLAAAAAVALVLRLLPADLPGERFSRVDLLVLLAWGLAAGLGYWLAGRRLLRGSVEEPMSRATSPWGTARLALGALLRGLLGWPLFAALVLLLRPPLTWAVEMTALAQLVRPAAPMPLDAALTLALGAALAAAIGRAEGRGTARRLLHLARRAAR